MLTCMPTANESVHQSSTPHMYKRRNREKHDSLLNIQHFELRLEFVALLHLCPLYTAKLEKLCMAHAQLDAGIMPENGQHTCSSQQ